MPAPRKQVGEGTVIDDRYRVVRKIGVGTSGAVYEGIQMSVDRRVAIKILKPAHFHDDNYRERFTREAKAIARLSHTNCIALHDFGYSEEFDTLYMIMEYVDGVELFELIQDGKLSFVRSLRIAIQIAEALGHSHRLGILHRDLKPENVVVGKDDVIKVLDFGLARMIDLFGDDSGRRLTADGTIYGTPSYMSPEQCGGELEVTVHSDIYSLGIILYQLFEGRLPFDSRDIVGVLLQHKTAAPPPMTASVPPRLKALIFKMLEKDKANRPNTAYEVADILRAILLSSAMRDESIRSDFSQEIQLSFLKAEIDESREFISDSGNQGQEYGLSIRGSGKHRAIRAAMSGRGQTERLPGQHLNNRYKIFAELGSGATSTVFVAEDVQTKQTVAIKVLSADVPAELRGQERFEREIATLDGLNHPNIVKMLGHGFDLALDRRFIVMELVSGDTLDTLCEGHRTSLELGVLIAHGVASALEYAHQRRVIHRDIKPSNIMVVPERDGSVSVRVLDFGLALMHNQGRRLTEQGTIPGTVSFFPPERLRGQDATTAADIYSLGLVLYCTLSGYQPFEGRTSVDVAAAILRGGLTPLSEFVQEVPEALSQLLVEMIDPDPARRPSASEVRSRLEVLCRENQIQGFRVQHKGPASDIPGAWRLRRRVVPSSSSALSLPAPEVVSASLPRQEVTTGRHELNATQRQELVERMRQKPSSEHRVVLAIVLVLVVLLVLVLISVVRG